MLTVAKILKDLQAVDNNLQPKAVKAGPGKAKTAAKEAANRPGMARFRFLCALEGLAKLPIGDDKAQAAVNEAYAHAGVVPKLITLLSEYTPNAAATAMPEKFSANNVVVVAPATTNAPAAAPVASAAPPKPTAADAAPASSSSSSASAPASAAAATATATQAVPMHGERSVIELAVYALGRLTIGSGGSNDTVTLRKLVKEHGPELFGLLYHRLLSSPHRHDQIMALRTFVEWCAAPQAVELMLSLGVLPRVVSLLRALSAQRDADEKTITQKLIEGLTSKNAAETLRTLRMAESELAQQRTDDANAAVAAADAAKSAGSTTTTTTTTTTATDAAAPPKPTDDKAGGAAPATAAGAAAAAAADGKVGAAASSTSTTDRDAAALTPEQKTRYDAQQKLVHNILKLTGEAERKAKRQGGAEAKAAKERDEQVTRLESLCLAWLANLSVSDDSVIHTQLLKAGLNDDQLFQSCKLLANVGIHSGAGEQQVVRDVQSFGSVMALSSHVNPDVSYVAKRLMLCFPTGKLAQKGKIQSTAAISAEEQQQFTRRYMQLKRDRDRSGRSKAMDLASIPYAGGNSGNSGAAARGGGASAAAGGSKKAATAAALLSDDLDSAVSSSSSSSSTAPAAAAAAAAPAASAAPVKCDGPGCAKTEGGGAGGAGSFLQCSACKRVKYCGAACQKAHWKGGHKKQCSSK